VEWLNGLPIGKGGTIGAIGFGCVVVAFALRFLTRFQRDFTDKYQARVQELERRLERKDHLIARLRVGIAVAVRTLITSGTPLPPEVEAANNATEDDDA
jgi:hypothetical protein